MPDYLVIRLGEHADDPVSWMAVDERGTRRGHPGRGALTDAAREMRERAVIVLVPATEVLTLTADIPAKGARLLAALPYALEDQVADDIDKLHFAPGQRQADGAMPIAVVSTAAMDDWLERLADAGITANKLIPENHGLPRTPNTLSMLVTDSLLMFNDGGATEFVISDVGPTDVVAASGAVDADDEAATRHLLVYCEESTRDRYDADWTRLRAELSSVDITLLPDGVLPRLAVTVASGAGVNLLQGAYGVRTEVAAALRPWRFAAIFLIALGFVALLGKSADFYRLGAEEEALQQQFLAEYQRINPNFSADIVDPGAIVNSLRQGIGTVASGPQVFLPSMQTLATALRENDAADVEAVSYRAGVATVRLNAPDIPTLDSIVQSIDSSVRFKAELKGATNVGDRVQSRLEIREAGS